MLDSLQLESFHIIHVNVGELLSYLKSLLHFLGMPRHTQREDPGSFGSKHMITEYETIIEDKTQAPVCR